MAINSEARKPTASPRRHLFIINPAAKRIKGKVKPVKDAIDAFFAAHTWIKYDVYVSQWCRDSIIFIRQYIADKPNESIRIHVMGGTCTLFEVINSVVNIPNVEVASHPYGKANTFLKYFGAKNVKLFSSMTSQVFDTSVPIDVLCGGNNYGICYGMAGIEAHANVLGEKLMRIGLPGDISFMLAGAMMVLGGKAGQNYFLEIDDNKIEGDFLSVMIANTPCYGVNMYSAIDAHPDDGILDVYIVKNAPKFKVLTSIAGYTHGKYRRMPDLVSHYRAKKIKLSSDEIMYMSIDAEHFYGKSIEYEIIPQAVRFVCPVGIDPQKVPRIYNRPQEGMRSE